MAAPLTTPVAWPAVPRYGSRSLADLSGSLMSSLGVPGFENPLGIEPAARICLLLIDGLGDELLRTHAQAASFLASLRREPLTAGFPATTAASLPSLGTARPPGEHGLVGYTMAIDGYDRLLNNLGWALYGIGPRTDLRSELIPEQTQPLATIFERAEAAGIPVTHVGKAIHEGSGFTRATLRGGTFVAADTAETVAGAAARAISASDRAFVYAYYADLDYQGHVAGPLAQSWRDELMQVDRMARGLADRMPPGALLVITGDHGMVPVAQDHLVDLDREPELTAGIRLVGGEARVRHLYVVPGADADVAAAWQARLGDRMSIWTRDEVITLGLFGPTISDRARSRIGDLVAAAFGSVGVVQRSVDPAQGRFAGHHGSLTRDEQLVPLLLYRG